MTGSDDPLPERRPDDAQLPSAAVGNEILRASLESLRQFAASQEALARSLQQEKVASWWRTGVLAVAVLAVVVFLAWSGFQMQRQSQAVVESLQRSEVSSVPAAADPEQHLRDELLQMRQRLADLEIARRAAASEALLEAAGPATPSLTPRWQPEQPSGRPTGDPTGVTATEKNAESWKEGLLRGMELGAGFRPDPEPDAVVGPGDASDEVTDMQDPATLERLAKEQRELGEAVNQLFTDAGMNWLTFVEGTVDVERGGIKDVVMTSSGDAGVESGTIQAGLLRLIRDPITEEAHWLCEQAFSTQGGVRVEYPGRRLVLEVPGRLPMEWVRAPLAALVREPGPEEADVSPLGLTETYNQLLEDVEEVPVRFRSIERRSAGTLLNIVVEWWEADRTGDLRELHVDQAWWELDETRANLVLVCRGGTLKVGEVRRPFFRGQYRLPLRNVNVQAWRAIPCVRRISAHDNVPSAAESSGGGTPP